MSKDYIVCVGSKTYDGVRFSVYPNDHLPPHVHGTAEGVTIIIDLLADGNIVLSSRRKAVVPENAKQKVIAKIRRMATENADELFMLWEKTHGTKS